MTDSSDAQSSADSSGQSSSESTPPPAPDTGSHQPNTISVKNDSGSMGTRKDKK